MSQSGTCCCLYRTSVAFILLSSAASRHLLFDPGPDTCLSVRRHLAIRCCPLLALLPCNIVCDAQLHFLDCLPFGTGRSPAVQLLVLQHPSIVAGILGLFWGVVLATFGLIRAWSPIHGLVL